MFPHRPLWPLTLVLTACLQKSLASGLAFVSPDTSAATEWRAAWIGVDGPSQPNQWLAFRHTFEASPTGGPAIARIAADSKYWLWLNGRLFVREGGLKRGPTPRDTYYDEVDLSANLSPGTNTLAILLWHFGKEGFSHKSSGRAGLLFQLESVAATVRSDATWRAIVHPAFGDTDAPHPNYRLPESNVRFDAGRDIPAWETSGFDATAWPRAVALGRAPCAPWGELVRRPVPLWRDHGLQPYENASAFPDVSNGGVIVARLPHNAQVTPYLKIEAQAGLAIDVRTDNYEGGSATNVRAEYLTRAGVQEFECPGWMNGHAVRYSFPAGIKILDLRYRESGFATDFSGEFTCDDAFLNRLRTKAVRTLYITMRDTYMDCPDRERALWWGDAVLELGEAFYALDRRSDSLARKSILELVGWQKPDGVLFAPVPAGNWDRDLPMQMLASVGRTGFWTYGLYSGDLDTLRSAYPAVKRYLEIWDLRPDGLVVPRKGAWEWGDWGDNVDLTVLYNGWYLIGLHGMEEMARALGHTDDLPWIAARRAGIEAAFNPAFWNGREYRSPAYTGHTDDRANALAVVAGLARPDQTPALLEVFKTQNHASPYMEKYVLEALCLLERPDLAQDRIRLRYAKMVEHPELATLWEGWGIGREGFGGGTINHAWSGGPLTLMSQYFAGIAPTTPGFATYRVRPQPGSLTRLSAKVVTVRGDIHLALQDDASGYILSLTSPATTVARIVVPARRDLRGSTLRVNGEPLWSADTGAQPIEGVTLVSAGATEIEFEVRPGQWTFTRRYAAESPASPAAALNR
jgi:hypothetical protein